MQFHLKKGSILNRYLVSATGCVHVWGVAWDRAVILYTCQWRGSEILSRMFFRKCQLIHVNVMWECVRIDYTLFVLLSIKTKLSDNFFIILS